MSAGRWISSNQFVCADGIQWLPKKFSLGDP